MINRYLDQAIGELKELIDITNADIQNIQKADHSAVDAHTKKKAELVKKFENTKSLLDSDLINLAKANSGTDLADILSNEVKDKLSELRTALETLQKVNKEYAKSVVVVKEFYDSLLKTMFGGSENSSYKENSLSPEQLFKLRV